MMQNPQCARRGADLYREVGIATGISDLSSGQDPRGILDATAFASTNRSRLGVTVSVAQRLKYRFVEEVREVDSGRWVCGSPSQIWLERSSGVFIRSAFCESAL